MCVTLQNYTILISYPKVAKEIERKYLVVNDDYRGMAHAVHEIIQGYLSTAVDATVRVRVIDDQAFLTVKSRNDGCSRNEWEYEIPVADGMEMLKHCDPLARLIQKRRYVVDAGDGLKWEIDEFGGDLEPLVVAEIELPAVDTPFRLPAFIGDEVTDNPAYFNSNLSKR